MRLFRHPTKRKTNDEIYLRNSNRNRNRNLKIFTQDEKEINSGDDISAAEDDLRVILSNTRIRKWLGSKPLTPSEILLETLQVFVLSETFVFCLYLVMNSSFIRWSANITYKVLQQLINNRNNDRGREHVVISLHVIFSISSRICETT